MNPLIPILTAAAWLAIFSVVPARGQPGVPGPAGDAPAPRPAPSAAPVAATSLPSPATRPATPPAVLQAGVNIHFTREMPGELAMIRRAGFSVVRMDLFWHEVEKEPGVYDFRAYDALMDALDREGLRAQFILCYTHALYDDDQSPHTEAGIEAFARYAAAAASHFRGRRIDWEIYNEPNIAPFWRPQPDAAGYARLAMRATRAIREADPEAVVIGPATSHLPLDFLATCFEAGLLEHWDAVTVHPYRRADPETVVEDYRPLRSLIRTHAPAGRDVPIWSGEWGYSTAWPAIDDAEQARRLQRQMLVNLSQGVTRSVWYDWRDDGTDPRNPEHRFGIVRHPPTWNADEPFTPKPAYHAARQLLGRLEGFAFDKRLWTGDDRDWVLLFAREGVPAAAAWTTSPEPRTLSLPILDAPLTLTRDVKLLDATELNAAAIDALAAPAVPIDTLVTAPAPSPDGSTLTRGDDGRALVVRTPLPGGGEIAQRTVAAVRNFVTVQWHPRTDGFDLEVRGTPGEPFDGTVTLVQPDRVFNVAWRADEEPSRRGWVFIRDDQAPVATLREAGGGVLQRRAAPRLRRVPLHPYATRVGGDAHVHAAVRPGGDPFDGDLFCTYAFDEGWKYLEINPEAPVEVPDDAVAFGLWLAGGGAGKLLRMRFIDAGGETWQVDGPAMSFHDQRFVVFPLDGREAGHWGGDANGRIDPPIRVTTFLLVDSATRQKTSGSVHLTGAAFVRRPAP